MAEEGGLDAAVRTLEEAAMLLAYEHAAFLHEIGVAPELVAAAYRTPNAELRYLPRTQEMQREPEEMLRSPDAERRRAGEELMRQGASIRRAGEMPHRPPPAN
jgi:hypothetical protein